MKQKLKYLLPGEATCVSFCLGFCLFVCLFVFYKAETGKWLHSRGAWPAFVAKAHNSRSQGCGFKPHVGCRGYLKILF